MKAESAAAFYQNQCFHIFDEFSGERVKCGFHQDKPPCYPADITQITWDWGGWKVLSAGGLIQDEVISHIRELISARHHGGAADYQLHFRDWLQIQTLFLSRVIKTLSSVSVFSSGGFASVNVVWHFAAKVGKFLMTAPLLLI